MPQPPLQPMNSGFSPDGDPLPLRAIPMEITVLQGKDLASRDSNGAGGDRVCACAVCGVSDRHVCVGAAGLSDPYVRLLVCKPSKAAPLARTVLMSCIGEWDWYGRAVTAATYVRRGLQASHFHTGHSPTLLLCGIVLERRRNAAAPSHPHVAAAAGMCAWHDFGAGTACADNNLRHVAAVSALDFLYSRNWERREVCRTGTQFGTLDPVWNQTFKITVQEDEVRSSCW